MLELTEINDDVNVKINSNGILDMSNLGECSVNDFYGGGTLVLAKDGLLTVNRYTKRCDRISNFGRSKFFGYCRV